MKKLYIQHEGRVINTGGMFKHVMAITLDPTSKNTRGIIRCITSREGNLMIAGNVDRSELYIIQGNSLEHFDIKERLEIKGSSEIIEKISNGFECIGLEDPDIFIDENEYIHLYFTIAFMNSLQKRKYRVHLGHAIGKSLDALEMTIPALLGNENYGAKEVSIAPLNQKGFRFNLIESSDIVDDTHYSVVRIVIAKDMGKPWEYGKIVFHPKDHNLSWIAGHASPGPLFSKEFIDIGEGKLLGIMNGCEANQKIGEKTKYGTFSVGLFIYDYENGKIDWVSDKSLIEDTEAGRDGGRAITFASQFVETKPGEGILYAHVDDSFVRAYTLNADLIKTLLPESYIF